MKEIIYKNKVYISIIAIMFICSLIVVLIAFFNKDKKNRKLYIALSEDLVLLYSNKEYKNITTERESYNWLKYDIYTENEKIGNYQLYNYNDKWYVFDDNKEEINVNDNFIAFSGDIEYEKIMFDKQELDSNDINKLINLLKEDGISFDGKLTINKKIVLDIDNDNKSENIYSVSNAWSDNEPDEIFSLVYIEDDEEITILEKNINKANENDIGSHIYSTYDISYIIDIDKNKKYDLVIKYLSDDGICNKIYSKVKKDYVKQIGC